MIEFVVCLNCDPPNRMYHPSKTEIDDTIIHEFECKKCGNRITIRERK